MRKLVIAYGVALRMPGCEHLKKMDGEIRPDLSLLNVLFSFSRMGLHFMVYIIYDRGMQADSEH